MEISTESIERACKLMGAKLTDEYHEPGFSSIVFGVQGHEFRIAMGLPDSMFFLTKSSSSIGWTDCQFIFRSNGIEFKTWKSHDGYMLCFIESIEDTISPKLLIAGGKHGVTHFRFLSVPAAKGGFEFPRQL